VQAFRLEQTRPDVFYRALALDSVTQVEEFIPLAGRTVLDVGAGPPQFAEAFRDRGARYLAIDHDADELAGHPTGAAVVARAERLPLCDGSVDIAFSSNVVEHVPDPAALGDELVRVTRPGGVVVLTYTNWLSPWGGHETSPFHYLGGRRAVRRYTRHHGRRPKNRIGENLFPVSVAWGLRWARDQPHAELLAARPRYYPAWAAGLLRVPGVREVATWNLLLALRRR
jgi:SAM-dependent methyltransferase